MRNNKQPEPNKVSLDELAREKLSPEVNDAFVKWALEDQRKWQETKFGLRFMESKGLGTLEMKVRFRIKRLLAYLTSLIGLAWVGLQFVFPYLAEVFKQTSGP